MTDWDTARLQAERRDIRQSLQQWVRAQIARGHPAKQVYDVIQAEGERIANLSRDDGA